MRVLLATCLAAASAAGGTIQDADATPRERELRRMVRRDWLVWREDPGAKSRATEAPGPLPKDGFLRSADCPRCKTALVAVNPRPDPESSNTSLVLELVCGLCEVYWHYRGERFRLEGPERIEYSHRLSGPWKPQEKSDPTIGRMKKVETLVEKLGGSEDEASGAEQSLIRFGALAMTPIDRILQKGVGDPVHKRLDDIFAKLRKSYELRLAAHALSPKNTGVEKDYELRVARIFARVSLEHPATAKLWVRARLAEFKPGDDAPLRAWYESALRLMLEGGLIEFSDAEWKGPGTCEVGGGLKAHRVMRCIPDHMECLRCFRHGDGQRKVGLCFRCIEELGMCSVCLKQVK